MKGVLRAPFELSVKLSSFGWIAAEDADCLSWSHLQNSRKDEFQESQISKTPENQGLLELVLPILRGFARGSLVITLVSFSRTGKTGAEAEFRQAGK